MHTPSFIACRLRRAHKGALTVTVHRIGIISVALGVATSLVALLTLKGFQHSIEQKLTGFGGHIYLMSYFLGAKYDAPPLDSRKLPHLSEVLPAIRAVKAYAHKAALFKAAEDVEGIVCKGLDPTAAHCNLQPYLVAGRLIDLSKSKYSCEVILSTTTAKRLRVKVGDSIWTCALQNPSQYKQLQVVGLYTTYIPVIDEQLALCDLRLIQRLNGWPAHLVGGYEIFLQHWQQVRTMAKQLPAWLDNDWGIRAVDREYVAIMDWLIIIRKNALVFMVLILLVVCTNLASVILIQMMERTAMLGTLRTLGASNSQQMQIMLIGNLYMVMQGMLWGNGVGLGGCALQHYLGCLTLDPTYYYMSYVPIAWDWRLILELNVLVLVVIIAVLLITITLITRYKPIKAIRMR
ncbi:MAG: FtsX-like permease family protein [Bacteroidota bacterium]